MIVRLALGLVLLATLALAQPSRAAGFDCAKASTPVEKAICADPELNRLDSEMSEQYRAAYTLLQGFDREDLKADQLAWLQRRDTACQIEDTKDLQDTGNIDCLRRMTRSMIENIKVWQATGRTVVLEKDATTQKLCSVVLAKRNIIWDERSDGVDRYYLRYLAQDQSQWEPVIVGANKLQSADTNNANFDFLNAGYPNSVKELDPQFHLWGLRGLVAIKPGEESMFNDRMIEALHTGDREVVDKFAGDLRHKPGTPIGTPQATLPLKSYLIDPSNTPIFGGKDTNLVVLSLGKRTYVLAQSVNNLGGPTGALFRPNASGELDLLCYHHAPHSHSEKRVVKDSVNLAICPIGHKEIPIDWQPVDEPGLQTTAIVFLSDWGGSRTVHKEQDGLYVGKLTSSNTSEGEDWLSFVRPSHYPWEFEGTEQIILTDDGGFLAFRSHERITGSFSDMAKTVYFHIEKDDLVEVCTGADIPPPGYAIR